MSKSQRWEATSGDAELDRAGVDEFRDLRGRIVVTRNTRSGCARLNLLRAAGRWPAAMVGRQPIAESFLADAPVLPQLVEGAPTRPSIMSLTFGRSASPAGG